MAQKRTSLAAYYSADELFKKYDFTVHPPGKRTHHYANLQASTVHAAILIDNVTQIYQIANLRPEMSYWQDMMKTGLNDNTIAKQICFFLQKCIRALEAIPRYAEEETPQIVTRQALTTAGAFAVQLKLSKASLEAMNVLFYYYALAPKTPQRFPDERITRADVAALLEACLQVGKAVKTLPVFRQCEARLRRGQATPEEIVAVLKWTGLQFEFLASYDFHHDRTMDRDEVKMLL